MLPVLPRVTGVRLWGGAPTALEQEWTCYRAGDV